MTDLARPLTPAEVATLLGVHANTVKRIPVEDLPYFKISTRGDRRYRFDDVQRYVDAMTARPGWWAKAAMTDLLLMILVACVAYVVLYITARMMFHD